MTCSVKTGLLCITHVCYDSSRAILRPEILLSSCSLFKAQLLSSRKHKLPTSSNLKTQHAQSCLQAVAAPVSDTARAALSATDQGDGGHLESGPSAGTCRWSHLTQARWWLHREGSHPDAWEVNTSFLTSLSRGLWAAASSQSAGGSGSRWERSPCWPAAPRSWVLTAHMRLLESPCMIPRSGGK